MPGCMNHRPALHKQQQGDKQQMAQQLHTDTSAGSAATGSGCGLTVMTTPPHNFLQRN